jgi:hypothetical protein
MKIASTEMRSLHQAAEYTVLDQRQKTVIRSELKTLIFSERMERLKSKYILRTTTDKLQNIFFIFSIWLHSPSDLGHFFSFLIIYTVGRTPWTGISPSQGPNILLYLIRNSKGRPIPRGEYMFSWNRKQANGLYPRRRRRRRRRRRSRRKV